MLPVLSSCVHSTQFSVYLGIGGACGKSSLDVAFQSPWTVWEPGRRGVSAALAVHPSWPLSVWVFLNVGHSIRYVIVSLYAFNFYFSTDK